MSLLATSLLLCPPIPSATARIVRFSGTSFIMVLKLSFRINEQPTSIMSSLFFLTQPTLLAAVTYKFIISGLSYNHLQINISYRQHITIIERHVNIRLKVTLIQLRSIGRMLINNTPTCIDCKFQLCMRS